MTMFLRGKLASQMRLDITNMFNCLIDEPVLEHGIRWYLSMHGHATISFVAWFRIYKRVRSVENNISNNIIVNILCSVCLSYSHPSQFVRPVSFLSVSFSLEVKSSSIR